MFDSGSGSLSSQEIATDDARHGRRSSKTSRRAFLATGAAVSFGSLAGCLGGSGQEGDGPEPPWETEQLADAIDGDETITIYAGTGDAQEWQDLITVINDEFGTNLEADVYADSGGPVSQRFLQEHQADNTQADILSVASDIWDEIKITAEEDGKDEAEQLAGQYYETDINENFWFNDVLPDEHQLPFMASCFNAGAGVCLPVSEDYFEENGLDYPEDYNDLFDDQYEGMSMAIPSFVVSGDTGWLISHHAEQTDMGNLEWIEALQDHLNFVGANSYTAATRNIGEGEVATMIHNFPWVVQPFVSEFPIRGIFPPGVAENLLTGGVGITKNAPNPWVARFFLSAYLEEPVQRRIINDVKDQSPVRTDLDYSPQNPDRFMRKRLNADTTEIGFYEGAEFSQVGQRAKDNGVFDI